MKIIKTIIVALVIVSCFFLGKASASTGMSIESSLQSKVNGNYYYEKMVDPDAKVICYSLMNNKMGTNVSISCVQSQK